MSAFSSPALVKQKGCNSKTDGSANKTQPKKIRAIPRTRLYLHRLMQG